MSTYRDQQLSCESCGRTFFFTVTDQRRLEREGKEIEAPTLCPSCCQRDPATGKQRGQIKWFRLEKGYGFVRAAGGDEFFFHRSRTLEPDLSKLREGVEVLFEVTQTPKGSEAVQVELAAEESPQEPSSAASGGAAPPLSPTTEEEPCS